MVPFDLLTALATDAYLLATLGMPAGLTLLAAKGDWG